MADESQVVRSVDWKTLFPFTLIFRSFRIAVHPSKLILAMLAIVFMYVGGRALDYIWPEKYSALSNGEVSEIDLYANQAQLHGADYGKVIETANKARLDELEQWAKRYNITDKRIGAIKWMIEDARDKKVAAAKKAYDEAKEKNDYAYHIREEAMFAARKEAASEWNKLRELRKRGLFDTFMNHQLNRVDDIIGSVRSGEWITTSGVTAELRKFLSDAPVWAIRQHPVFFGICFLYMLAVWAVFGGAIARIAAVHVARDEKISIRQALRFSTAKFLSFFSAPLIPLIIIMVIGLVLAAGGLLVSLIPFVGPVAVGAGFFLFLLGGFLITLVFFGWIGGSGLMYPTVAVEGSDSFDAISRSFSYLYARPWRLAFYSAIALLYGSICYIFIRFFIYAMLLVTQRATGMWSFGKTATGADVFGVMYGRPQATQFLSQWPNYFDLGPGQSIGAFLIWLWVSLVVSALGAFAISFYFSSGTIIYMLLRNDVDATEMDDVYIDQPDEEFMETAPSTVTTATTTVVSNEPVVTPTPQPPAEEKPAEDNPPANPQ